MKERDEEIQRAMKAARLDEICNMVEMMRNLWLMAESYRAEDDATNFMEYFKVIMENMASVLRRGGYPDMSPRARIRHCPICKFSKPERRRITISVNSRCAVCGAGIDGSEKTIEATGGEDMTTLEMIDKIAAGVPLGSSMWHSMMDLRARVESERAALREAVDALRGAAEYDRSKGAYEGRPYIVAVGDGIDEAREIITAHTGVAPTEVDP